MAFPLFLGGDTMVFTKTFGGRGNDFAYSIRQTGDGGYIVAGQKDSVDYANVSYPDLWILRLDSSGQMEWDKTFGEPGKGDGASSVQLTTDDGFVVAGTTSSGIGYPSMWLIRLDQNGDTLWTRTYQGAIVSLANDVGLTADGGYVLAGKGEHNVLKADSLGKMLWGAHYSWIFYSVQQTTDGGFIAAGDSIYRNMGWDYIPSVSIFKLDGDGKKEWSNPLGNDFLGRVNCIRQASDGGYIAAGDSIATKSQYERSRFFMVVKFDGNGHREWNYYGPENSDAQFIRQTDDDGYIVAGNRTDEAYGLDFLIVKLDKNGGREWEKVYGKSGGWEYASSVQQTSDGGYVVAGQTDSYGAGRYDMWILKLDRTGNGPGTAGIPEPDDNRNKGFTLFQNHPNPFSQSTCIRFILPEPGFVTLAVLDTFGKIIETIISEKRPAGEYQVEWTAKNLPPGIYFYCLQEGGRTATKSFILIQ